MFLELDGGTGDLLVVGEMAVPPASLPDAAAGDHILFRANPAKGTMVAVGFFGGSDAIVNVGGKGIS